MKDWDYIADLMKRRRPKADDNYMAEIMNETLEYPHRKEMHQQGPLLYQDMAYAIARIMRPDYVVETGVRHGVCTSFILLALGRQGFGGLVSCDPMYSSRAAAVKNIAELIKTPDHLFSRWQFLPGLSSDWLMDEAMREPCIDLFIHDSDHSYENMAWELDQAWSCLNLHGIIICDDWDMVMDGEADIHAKHGNPVEQFCRQLDVEFHTIGTAAVIERDA